MSQQSSNEFNQACPISRSVAYHQCMAGDTEQNLIRAYARNRSEEAFGELVHRHVDLVHSTALRVLRDAGLAEDVTQRVFVALAQNAGRLQERTSLTSWLHETARNFAVSTVRSEERRRLREKEAISMNIPDSTGAEDLWKQVIPHLDGALARLSETDRDVILWRYFERQTAEQIGVRLGLSGEAAQKRIVRALDRLRTTLAERGLTAPATSLAALLSAQAVQAAPAGLAAAAIAAVGSTGIAFSTASTLQIIMASTKVKIGLAALLAASVTTPLILQHQKTSHLTDELAALRQQMPEMDRLRDEVLRLTTAAQSYAGQREKDRAELARLRAELTTLKAREPKSASAAKSPPPANPNKRSDTSNTTIGTLVRAEEWKNIGFKIPSSTVQTLAWAKINGDTNVIFNAIAWADDKSRAGVEALFAAAPESVRAKYGSADAYVTSLFNHSGPLDDRHTLTSYRILEEKVVGDEAILQLEYHYADGSTPTGPMRYVRIGDAWRQALDFGEPEQGKMSTSLQAEGENPPTALVTGK